MALIYFSAVSRYLVSFDHVYGGMLVVRWSKDCHFGGGQDAMSTNCSERETA